MKHFSFRTLLLVLPLLGLLVGGCKKAELDDYYTTDSEPGFAGLGLPRVALATRYAPTEAVPLYVSYAEADKLRDVTVFQVIGKIDSTVTGTFPANGTYNTTGGLQVMPVPYTVPTTAPNGTLVRVDVTLNFQNGAKRLRRFTYTVAAPATLEFATTPPVPTYRNGLAGTAQSEGDIVGYSLILNKGGLGAVPVPPATGLLFKGIDSLTTFYRIGTQPRVRAGVVRNPTTGAANTRTVDATIPRNSNGQPVTFIFEAYAAVQTLTITAPAINVTAPTPLATLRTGRIAGGPSVTLDSLAFNLRTGTIEPAANPPAAKDLFLSGTGNNVTLSAANNTRFYRATPAQVAAGFYTSPNANLVATTLFQNTTVADVGTVAANDVFAVRVRGAEVMLLRILSVKAGSAGAAARVRFEYRSL
ncbi:hypothetical protein MUN81_07875 [Hymenobacter sp. 5317J-9]|uniref:hypothetical protein n=1 Tax=Hymenobacter sp. 5317J-9 TaxID=2932250 RepID=UPI001FD6E0C3|nr:hypothetical protein [Hymenobacter sp. 5317J-9]UOQ99406.1 hypothetical protein MUN81_07875 [Hymenobacter sp. 5317J-9]